MKTQTTQHTPGPWHIGVKQANRIIYDSKGNAVADATTFYFDSTKELILANARLIAAAPELLEALKALLNERIASEHLLAMHMPDYKGDINSEGWVVNPSSPAMDLARSVILKATGGQS